MVLYYSLFSPDIKHSKLSDNPTASLRQRQYPNHSNDHTQPNTESTELPRELWADAPLVNNFKPFDSKNCNSKMNSFCGHLHQGFRDFNSYINPDAYTSAGLVANAYPRFKTNFWLDRGLIWLHVIIPILKAVLIILLHAIYGVARCAPKLKTKASRDLADDFVDRACGLQLTSDVLRGDAIRGQNSFSNPVGSIQIQHECYPFILLTVAVIMWIPHYLYYREVDKTTRRDLCLVRSELHSFRRAVGQELNYLQAMTATSLDGAAPTNIFLSPGSTVPPGPALRVSNLRYTPGHTFVPLNIGQHESNSGQTTAATVGANSLPSQTPAPTVVHAQRPQSATMGTNRCGLLGPPTEASPGGALPLGYGDADLSAPGLLDLPCFQACHADWSLNTYLSAWQNTDFYWRRYLAKHGVLGAFQVIIVGCIFTLIALSKGAPFVPLFTCALNQQNDIGPIVCLLQTTFILNMSVFIWGFLTLSGLSLQIIFFYFNFVHSFRFPKYRDRYLGLSSRPAKYITGLDETRKCFFADYIRLLAYTAFRDTQCEIRSVSVSYSPELYRSDFHFIALLCTENAKLFPDAIHIHFWTERYARLSRRRFRRPAWTVRRGSFSHLVRCEDLSMKFNFSKIKVKAEVNDFGF